MKNLGIAAILVGALLVVLTLVGLLGQGATRGIMLAAVIMIVAGYLLYKRGQRPAP
jgi:hypothetical protein